MKLQDGIKIAVLEQICPTELEGHLQMSKARLKTFEDHGEEITIVSAAVLLLCITSIVITLATFFVTLFFPQKKGVFLKIKKTVKKQK